MAKIWLFVCLLLLAKFSKSAPIWDEEVEDDEDLDNLQPLSNNNDAYDRSVDSDGDTPGDDDQDNDDDGDYKSRDDAGGWWGNAGENKNDDENDKAGDEMDERGEDDTMNEDDNMNEDERKDNIDFHPANDVTKEVVEDSEGDMALDKNEDLDEYEIETEEEVDEGDLTDMGFQISKLKRIFNEDMPQEIAALQSHSDSLSKDLDSLNAKLEYFLKENGIQQDPAVPQPDEHFDYNYE